MSLARYLGAAVLARSADAGAAVGLVLLAATTPGSTVASGAVLAACLTAPHLLGPFLARRLDADASSNRILVTAMITFGVLIAVAAWSLGRVPFALTAVAVVAAGTCGPLLTGGLSSRLSAAARDTDARRADGWDATSYGVSGTAGPAAVAGLAAVTSPLAAVLTVAAAAVVGGLLVLTLPTRPPDATEAPAALSTAKVLRIMAASGPLRRVTYTTMTTAFAHGTLPILTVLLASALGVDPGWGATLIAAFGVGNLVGSILVTIFPIHADPERMTILTVAIMGLCVIALGWAPNLWWSVAGFVLVGMANAPFVVATLRARDVYAPTGGRAQVYVSVAALKVGASAAGTALAGLLTAWDPYVLFMGAGLTVVLAAVAALIDRRATA